MMKPTVGRVVYYNEGTKEHPKPLASIIAYVGPSYVNLMVIAGDGLTSGKTSVEHGAEGGQWDWMPYQKEKAAAGDHNSESAEPRPETASR